MKVKVNNISKENKKSMRQRILTALVLLCIGVPCILLGGWFFAALILLATVLITYEILNAPIRNRDLSYTSNNEEIDQEFDSENKEEEKSDDKKIEKLKTIGKNYKWMIFKKKPFSIIVYVLMYIMMISFVFWIFTNSSLVTFSSENLGTITIYDIRISTLAMAFFIALLFFAVMVDEKFTVHHACYIFTMGVFCSIAIQAILFLRFCPEGLYNLMIKDQTMEEFHYGYFIQSSFLFIFVIGGSLISDAYAYFVGIFLGHKKINERISPHKTWEGMIGGIILTAFTGIGFCFLCDALGAPVLKGFFDIKHWYWCVLFSLLIPVSSVLGDFMFSAIKRFYGIKDFGKTLPGHGGLLDRFDSVLITSLLSSCLILFIVYSPWNALIR